MPIYTKLRDKWKTILIGNNTVNTPTQYELKLIKDLDSCVTDYLKNICRNINRTYLWEDEADFTQSQKQTNNYRRVYEMCKAYSMEGSIYYKDQALLEVVQEALRFLYHAHYNTSHTYYYGNWWNWEIGTPITLLNIMTLLGDQLEDEERNKYCEVIYYFQPDPTKSGERTTNERIKRRTSVGGNRVDTVKIGILLGIHTKDKDLIRKSRNALSDVFEIKKYAEMTTKGEKRDGLYEDWSFIQHGDVAYTGTYGNVLLSGLGELTYLLNDSEWEVTDPKVENIYKMIINSFIPIIYKGHGMDCVNGRGATRQAWQNNKTGHDIIASMLWFGQFAPDQYRKQYQERIKYWLLNDTLGQFLVTHEQRATLGMAQALLEDETIKVEKPLIGNFAYTYMDRMIHHREKFSCALSMSSHRIRTYEPMLGENKKGFYTGDGMLYTYTSDQEEYNCDFWATIDPYKLAGTTIVEKSLADNVGSCRTPAKWVSAMSVDGQYGIAGMQLDKTGIDDETGEIYNPLDIVLSAKKSYFMLENEIVAIGSAIQSENEEPVVTTVDTRKINKEKSNTIDQAKQWIYVEGNQVTSSMGYYLLKEQEVAIKTYKREGTWRDVNDNGDDCVKEQDYVTLQINHGIKPKNATYGYVMLPGATGDELKAYSQSPTVTVVAQTQDIHAIKYKEYLMANIWQPCSVEGVKVDQPTSIVIKSTEEYLEITVCDPTKENKNLLKIDLKETVELIQSNQAEITIYTNQQGSCLEVRWQHQCGQAVQFKLKRVNHRK